MYGHMNLNRRPQSIATELSEQSFDFDVSVELSDSAESELESDSGSSMGMETDAGGINRVVSDGAGSGDDIAPEAAWRVKKSTAGLAGEDVLIFRGGW